MEDRYRFILKTSKVLLVENDNLAENSSSRILSSYIDNILLANDGLEAYQIYKQKSPNLIITDIKIPKLNGIELIKKIREQDNKIPIIATCTCTDKEYLLEAIKLSLIEYIVKPIKIEDLEHALTNAAKLLLENHNNTIIRFDDKNSYDFDNKIFITNDKEITLTNLEIKLFELLLLNRGHLLTKQNIENKLYPYEYPSPNALKNLIFKLRKKLPIDIIKTHRKIGYIIEN